MLYCPNFFWNVLQVWMTGNDIYLQMTWSWPDKTWNILCSYCLQWNTSQSKFRNHYFLFLFAFSILSQLFLIWGCVYIYIYTLHYCSISLPSLSQTYCLVPVLMKLLLKHEMYSDWLAGPWRQSIVGGDYLNEGHCDFTISGRNVL